MDASARPGDARSGEPVADGGRIKLTWRLSRRAALRLALAVPLGLALGNSVAQAAAPPSGTGARQAGASSRPADSAVRRGAVDSVETLVGERSAPGRFSRPHGVALAADGSLVVADAGNGRLQRLSLGGDVLSIIGGPGDGPGLLREPVGVAVAADGSLLVADSGNGRVVRFGIDGSLRGAWMASGAATGRLGQPHGLAVRAEGTVFVSDPEQGRIECYTTDGSHQGGWGTEEWHAIGLAATADGVWAVERKAVGGVKTTFHGRISRYSASGERLATIEGVTWPEMIALGPDGSLYVSDNGHFFHDPFTVRHLSPAGEPIRLFGEPGPGLAPGGFGLAAGLAVLADGRVVVADAGQDCVQVLSPDARPVGVLGVPRVQPNSLAVTDSGDVLLLSGGDPRLYRVGADGVLGVLGERGERAPARVGTAQRLTVCPTGEIVVVGAWTDLARRYDAAGRQIGEVSLRQTGPPDGLGAGGVAVDEVGNLYVTRALAERVFKLGPDGALLASWPIGEGTTRPEGIAYVPPDTLYVADPYNGRVVRLSTSGEPVGTLLGPDVDGTPIRPVAVAVGAGGLLVVTDESSSRLLVVRDLGGAPEVVTLADLGLAPEARLGAVAVDPTGRVVVAVPDAGLVLRLALAD